jgi:hypothetical protein
MTSEEAKANERADTMTSEVREAIPDGEFELSTKQRRVVAHGDTGCYVPTGHLVYAQDGFLGGRVVEACWGQAPVDQGSRDVGRAQTRTGAPEHVSSGNCRRPAKHSRTPACGPAGLFREVR